MLMLATNPSVSPQTQAYPFHCAPFSPFFRAEDVEHSYSIEGAQTWFEVLRFRMNGNGARHHNSFRPYFPSNS